MPNTKPHVAFIVIIPARGASTRLPNKPLADIAGKPMVIRTVERALASHAQHVWVATDDTAIFKVVRDYGYDALLTRADHLTGTDRLAEAVNLLNLDDDAIVVNLQGDEPFMAPALIQHVAQLLVARPDAAIATCATPLTNIDDFFNPHIVKVVCTADKRALYFSRAPIPWGRDMLAAGLPQAMPANLPAWQHMGLYAYRAYFLRKFPHLVPGVLEPYESLEQIRALENGYTIVVHQAPCTPPMRGIDTEEDLVRARAFYAEPLVPPPPLEASRPAD